jgi:hypothetical protein
MDKPKPELPQGHLRASRTAPMILIEGEGISLILSHGETFGGRTFEEWATVADGDGTVSGDWLNV